MYRISLIVVALLVTGSWLSPVAELTDEESYQQARAHFTQEQYTEAIAICDQLLASDPPSPWQSKAAFLKADAYAALGQYDKTAAIYEQQAKRLIARQRQDETARIYLRFAQTVAPDSEAQTPEAPQPDYEKAHRLYEAALKLDISRSTREEILFLKAQVRQRAGQWSAAIQEYQEYLNAFDPVWQSGDSEAQADVKDTPRLYLAHLSMAECQVAAGQHAQARIVLEDLLRRIDAMEAEQAANTETIRRNAAYQLIQTHRFPERVTEQDFQLGLAAAKEFLGHYPTDPRSVELAYQIAQSYERHGHTEEAIAAYHAFIAREGFAISEPPSQAKESLQEIYERLEMEATYQTGALLFEQKRFAEAAEMWEQYVTQFPDGPRWTEVQRKIVDAEFQMGLELLSQGKYPQATAAWDAFLESHPLDPRCPQILFTYGQMQLTPASEDESTDPKPENLVKAIAIWERLVQKYPGTPEASLALFRIGEIYEQRLGQMEQALKTYRKVTWGSWAESARSRIAEMTQKRLRVLTERTFRTNETPKVRIKTRNIEKLNVSLYYLDLASYWRQYHEVMGVEQLDIGLIEPDQRWEYRIPDYTRYQPLDNAIEIPMDGPGVALVHLSEDDFEATTLVIRSDLEAIVKSSRREVFVFVQDMLGMRPADGAHVLVTDGEKLVAEGTTNADGVMQQPLPETAKTGELSVFVSKQGHVASNILDTHGLDITPRLRPRGYVYTDRPAYQPGETVHIRGIVQDVRDGSYTVVAGTAHTLTVLDANGRVLHEEQVSLSEFGTFHTQVALDLWSPTGEYRISVKPQENQAISFTGTFIVDRFRLEKIHLDMTFSQSLYFRGERVEGTVTATYYHGGIVRHRPLLIELPDGRTLSRGWRGQFLVRYNPLPIRDGAHISRLSDSRERFRRIESAARGARFCDPDPITG